MPPSPRQGYRNFVCDECGCRFTIATRDFRSPSIESCPKCNADAPPEKGWPDASLEVDKVGNLASPPPITLHD